MSTVTATFYAQIEPELSAWDGSVVGAKIGRVTQRKPQPPKGGTVVVQLSVKLPRSLFEPVPTQTIELWDMAAATPVEVVAHSPEADGEGHD